MVSVDFDKDISHLVLATGVLGVLIGLEHIVVDLHDVGQHLVDLVDGLLVRNHEVWVVFDPEQHHVQLDRFLVHLHVVEYVLFLGQLVEGTFVFDLMDEEIGDVLDHLQVVLGRQLVLL